MELAILSDCCSFRRIKQIIASSSLALLLLTTVLTVYSFAGVDMTVFGPKRYDRYKGAPNLYSDTFDRCEPSDLALLKITNGNGKDTTITSGRISINGQVVVSENEFKQQTLQIKKPISVLQHNELKVELKSSSRETSFVIVEIVGRNCDSQAPIILAPAPADGALLNISRPVISAGYRDEANGSGIDPSTAKLTVDGVDVTAKATVTAEGIAYTPASDLPEGSHEAVLSIGDRAANSSSHVWHFTTDTIAPTFKITAPVNGSYINTPTVTVSGSIDDPTAGVTLNGADANVTGDRFAFSGFSLVEGSNTIVGKAVDLAKNPSSDTITVNLDTVTPVVRIDTPQPAFLTNKAQVVVSGTISEEFAAVTVNGIPATVTGKGFTVVYTLAEGANVLDVRAVDRAGNLGSATSTGTLDSIAPAAPVFAASPTPTNVGTVTLNGTAEGNAVVRIFAGSSDLATVNADSDGKFTLVGVALVEGVNSFTATATDKAENESVASEPLVVVLDKQAPQLTVSTLANGSYTNNGTLNIAGTVVDNVGMQELKVNGVPVPVNADGSYSHALVLQDGANTVEVVATDKAGNPASDSRVVNLDRTAPVIVLNTPADNSKTKNPILQFEGSVDNEAVVELKMKETVYPAVMTGLNFTASINATYGYNTVEITATDLAGNKSTVKRTVLFDDRQPSLSVTDPGQDIRTNQSSLTVKGTAGDELTAVTLTVTMDGQTFAPTLVNGGFQQSVNFGAEKSYAVVVTATDEVGLSSSVQRNVIFDATPPALTVATVTSPTNQATQVMTGTMEEGAIVAVTCATATVGAVSYPTGSTWSATVSDLSLGVNNIAVEARDATGNVSSADAAITYDNVGPTGTISVESGSSVTGTASVQLQLNSTDSTGVTSMRFSTDGVTWTDPTAYTVNAPWTLSAGDGLKQIYVQYQDKAGNWSDSFIDEITLDTTAPLITISTPAAGSFVKTPQLTVSGTVNEEVASVTVNGTAAAVAGLAWNLPYALVEGANSFTVNAVDVAGNLGTGTVSVTLDTKAPTVTIATPAAGLTRIAQVTVSGTVSEEVATVTVNGAAATVAGTDWSLPYTLAELGNTLTVTATDRAGNSGSATVGVTLDSTAPSAPVLVSPTTPIKVASLTLSGSAEANATVKLYANAALIGTLAADGQGSFSLADVTLSEGDNSFTATATDAAGNESALSAAVTVTLDTVPPAIGVTAPLENAFLGEATLTVTGSVNEALSSFTVNGQQVELQGTAFQQTITLTPGINSIVLAATDLAGNPATKTVLVTLDSTPPVVTITAPISGGITKTPQVTVSGSISKAFTTATVNGTPVTVTDQAFNFVYTLQEGENTLKVEATDRAGNKGSASVTLHLDTQLPVLSIQTVAQATAGANIAISFNASDNNNLTLVELKADGVPIWSGGNTATVAESVAYRLSPSLSAGGLVLLQASGVDSAGNVGNAGATIAITQGAAGPGYLQGKVLEDLRGLRMEGATVSLIDAAGTANDLVTAADGGYFAELAAGATMVKVTRPGYLSVERSVTVLPEKRATANDARLTKISATPNVVDAAGATVRAEVGTGTNKKVIELEVPAGAVAAQSDLRLTPVSNQGLAGLLPAGWSPLAVADLRLLDATTGTQLASGFSAAATIKFPLPSSVSAPDANLILAVYDATAHQWRSKGAATIAADGLSAGAGVDGGGEYALLIADPAPNAPAAVEAGAPLGAATSQTLDYETVTAQGKVVPQASPPSTGLKAAGEVVLSAKEGVTPAFTSGLVLNSRITENFDLKSGDSVQSPSYTQDIILYRYQCLTNIGSGALSAVNDGTLRTTFPVAPSRDYSIVELLLGKVGLEITVPESVETGVMVGADGGRLVDADGNILAIPQGALGQTIPVSTKTGAEAPGVVGADFTLLKVVEVNLTGQTLATGATLSTAAPASLDPALPLLLARQIEVKGVAKLKLVALVKQSGTLLSSDTALSGVTLTGITGSGSYYFLQAKAPIGFVSGTVTDASGNAYTGAMVKTAQGSLVDLASSSGKYLLAAPVAPITATAIDLYKNDEVSGSVTLSANQTATLDLKILMLPPTLESVAPAGINIQPNASVVATFSKSIDKTSVSAATITLKDASGNVVPGVFTFSVDGKIVTFSPNELLKSEQSYTVTVGGGIKDLQGYALGADSVSTFTVRKTVPPPMPPAGAVSGTFPDADGFITVTATQGSAETGNTVLLINDATSEIVSVTPASNGSFTGRIRGQLGDEIQVVLMDYSGNRTLISYLTFKSDDGKYLVTTKGGKVEGENGSLLEIPEGALSSPTVLKVTTLDEGQIPALQGPGGYLGAVSIDTGGVSFRKAVEVSIPMPAGFDPATPVFITRPSQIVTIGEDGQERTENVYEIIDSTKVVGTRISSACEPFPGVWGGGPMVFTTFVGINPVVVSGYTYQDMNGSAGYQPAPAGVVEVPYKNPVTGDLVYKYDRPIPRAVIRASSAWNYVSYTDSKGFYGTFAAMFEVPAELSDGTNCMAYRVIATNPVTVFSDTFNGYVCAAPYNVPDVNFRLAEKATLPPDKVAPAIDISATKVPGQGEGAEFFNGVVTTGTELSVKVTVTDMALKSAALSAEFAAVDTANTRVTQLSLGDPAVTNLAGLVCYTYVPDFGTDYGGSTRTILKPLVPGLLRLVVEARDVTGNLSSKHLDLRVIDAGEQPLGFDGAPAVGWRNPEAGVGDVMIDSSVSVSFNEGVSGFNSNTFTLFDVTANLPVPADVNADVSSGMMKGILVPKKSLAYGHTYRASLLAGITDVKLNASSGGTLLPLEPSSWQFTTKMPTAGTLAADNFGGRDIDYYFANPKHYAYVAAGTAGWRVVDVSNAKSMKVVWPNPELGIPSVDFKFNPNFDYRHLAVDQQRGLLAVTDNVYLSMPESHFGYIRFYSLANPEVPVLVGREKLAYSMTGIPLRVSLLNGYAYVCTAGIGLQVVDFNAAIKRQSEGGATDGSTIVGYFNMNSPVYYGSPVFFTPYRPSAAVVTTTLGQLLTMDLSFPAMPTLVSAFQPEDSESSATPKPKLRFGAAAASADFAYRDAEENLKMMDVAVVGLTLGGVRIVNLNDTSNPQIVGTVKNEDGSVATMITRDITINPALGLAVAPALDAVYVIDIRNPYDPRVLNRISQLPSTATNADGTPVMVNLDGGQAVVESGGKLYLATPGSATSGAVKMIDLGIGKRISCNPNHPCDP